MGIDVPVDAADDPGDDAHRLAVFIDALPQHALHGILFLGLFRAGTSRAAGRIAPRALRVGSVLRIHRARRARHRRPDE